MYHSLLGGLPYQLTGRSRAINAENPTGEKGRGGMAAGPLGPARKGAPALHIPAGQSVVLADIVGPGIIEHLWITLRSEEPDTHFFALRDVVLRVYWDEEENPSVEVPVGDFFCNGFGAYCPVHSMPIVVLPSSGMNCYFSMPFRCRAKFVVENQHPVEVCFFYQIDYSLHDSLPNEVAYFHAHWNRQATTVKGADYPIVSRLYGKGAYVGTYLAITTLERYWWGEGEVKFYLDGDKEYPTICGTGLEDYFGGAWGFVESRAHNVQSQEARYSTLFLGYPYFSDKDPNYGWHNEPSCPPMRGLYRWHILDPIRFQESLTVTVQQIGNFKTGLFERQDDYSSVAYWYQTEPHRPFPPLAPAACRRPR